ncbi:MAG: hypothetical protein J3Q66DRAFT_186942 [Benniella sp.]|nr:MAG: hypothetical protein J3Q66DRAFT_186942 [Benniella sp.]
MSLLDQRKDDSEVEKMRSIFLPVVFLQCPSTNTVSVHNSTVDCLKYLIIHCITDGMIDMAAPEMKKNQSATREQAADFYWYHLHRRRQGVFFFSIFASKVLGLECWISSRLYSSVSTTLRTQLMVPLFSPINELFFAPAFTRHTHLGVVLPTAITTAGPRIILDISFFNIDNPKERKRGRAQLLPLHDS